MAQQQLPGFKILMIRNVPMGMVLNAETADSFELIESGYWISDNNHWAIMQVSEYTYLLAGHDTQIRYNGKTFLGPLDKILEDYKNIPEEHK